MAAKTSGLAYYHQGPEEALVQARWQAALVGTPGLLAAQRICLCLQVGEGVGLVGVSGQKAMPHKRSAQLEWNTHVALQFAL